MIELVKFINHVNEEIVIGKDGIFLNHSDLHDYSWKPVVSSNRISSFEKGIVQMNLPITICCKSEEEGLKIKNRLMEVCEKDVLSKNHGKLVVGGYYLKCFVTGSRKSEYLYNKGVMKVSLTITTDLPQWIKESTVSFKNLTSSDGGSGKRNFDYNFDFPFDYTSEMSNKKLINTGFVGSNFKIIIFGGALNPSIFIGGHEYCVNCAVNTDEYLTIDSYEKTITLTKRDGTTENKFNDRERSSYIFEAIPSGENSVTWSGDFTFDVIMLEERSEPKWI